MRYRATHQREFQCYLLKSSFKPTLGGTYPLFCFDRSIRICSKCHLPIQPDAVKEFLNKQANILEIGFVFLSHHSVSYHLSFFFLAKTFNISQFLSTPMQMRIKTQCWSDLSSQWKREVPIVCLHIHFCKLISKKSSQISRLVTITWTHWYVKKKIGEKPMEQLATHVVH